ncbi:unnamed protein product, partial [Medioppia subpectinata]
MMHKWIDVNVRHRRRQRIISKENGFYETIATRKKMHKWIDVNRTIDTTINNKMNVARIGQSFRHI